MRRLFLSTEVAGTRLIEYLNAGRGYKKYAEG